MAEPQVSWTWEDIDKNWGDIMERFPNRHENVRLNENDEWEKSGRPLIEEIICLRQARDNKLFQYLGLRRSPQVIDTSAENKLSLGHATKKRKRR